MAQARTVDPGRDSPIAAAWRRLDAPGFDHCRYVVRADGGELFGTAIFVHQGQPCRLDYHVTCDLAWRTRAARVAGHLGHASVRRELTVDGEGHWQQNGRPRFEVTGALDVDLGFSPATNFLALRRLALGVGESAHVTSAWLPFPDLTLAPLPQVYRRTGRETYAYEAPTVGFAATLLVNADGVIVEYPGLWHLEALGT